MTGFWGRLWGAGYWADGYWAEAGSTVPTGQPPGFWGRAFWAGRMFGKQYWREGAATGTAPVVNHGALWLVRRRRRTVTHGNL